MLKTLKIAREVGTDKLMQPGKTELHVLAAGNSKQPQHQEDLEKHCSCS
jgi:hypothetical protein